MNALRNVRTVSLINIPKITKMTLRFAFVGVKTLRMENASMLEKHDELRDLMSRVNEESSKHQEEERQRKEQGVVESASEFNSLGADSTMITVSSCDDYMNEVLDFSRFVELEVLKIGAKCFSYVSKLSIVGLSKLKSIVVEDNSFQNNSNDSELIIQNCPALATLSIGNNSFKDFRRFTVDSLPSLRLISIKSSCFVGATLSVKSFKSLKTIRLGEGSFERSNHTVIESRELESTV